jgi:hypothetical protein
MSSKAYEGFVFLTITSKENGLKRKGKGGGGSRLGWKKMVFCGSPFEI